MISCGRRRLHRRRAVDGERFCFFFFLLLLLRWQCMCRRTAAVTAASPCVQASTSTGIGLPRFTR